MSGKVHGEWHSGTGRIVEDGTPAELASGDGGYGGLHAAWAASLV